MRKYILWSGSLILLVMLLVFFVGGLATKTAACNKYYEAYGEPSAAPESTSTEIVAQWSVYADCQGVFNDLQLSYYFIALGVALIGISFVVKK